MAKYRSVGPNPWFALDGVEYYPDASGWITPPNAGVEQAMRAAGLVSSSRQEASGDMERAGAELVGRIGHRRLCDKFGNPLTRNAWPAHMNRRGNAEHSIWFPLGSALNNGQTTVYDFTGTLRGKMKGGSTGKICTEPGWTGNGTNARIECNDSDANAPQFSVFRAPPWEGFTQAVRACADLSSLHAKGDMILMWAVFTHPISGLAADGVLGGFGMNNDPLGKGGLAFGVKSSNNKPCVWHRGQGASALDQYAMTSNSITGVAGGNTKTAICFELTPSIAGYVDIASYMLTLGVDGGSAQSNPGMASISLLANGATAGCGQGITSPFTIGCLPDTVPYTKNVLAGTIGTGTSNQLTLSADFGAPGKAGALFAYNQGIYIWFGNQSTTPALVPGYYWCVFNDLRVATIYSAGPGSSPINFSAGVTISVPNPNRVLHWGGVAAGALPSTIRQIGVERRALDSGVGMEVVRCLRAHNDEYPLCLE